MAKTQGWTSPSPKNRPVNRLMKKLLPSKRVLMSVSLKTMKIITHNMIRNKPISHPPLASFTPVMIGTMPVVLSMNVRL